MTSSAESPDPDSLLDRLVDGELSEAERRQLLDSLDEQPGEWRRCALAFLEAQSWSQTFRELEPAPPNAPAVTSLPNPLPAGAARREKPRGLWALAAGVVVAFTLGMLFRNALVEERLPREFATQTQEQRATPSVPMDDGMETAPLGDAVTLVVDGGAGQLRRLEVPLVNGRQWDRLSQWNGRWTIPQHVLQHLEQTGHRIDRRRRYAPVQFDDGRRMIVPVDDLQITPVGRTLY